MAPGATPYVANWNFATSTMYSAWSWCYAPGIHNMNRSAGIGNGPLGPQADDMAQDYYAYHWPYPLITLAAGNCQTANGTLTPCSSPTNTFGVYVGNRSYNTLIVGASDGNATTQTSDDFLADFSQHINPVTTNYDHELPNLVAPGSEGYTIGVSSASWGARGTSAAAPITLGTVLLMKTRDSFFNSWPEMMRATIMTASTRPVDGPRTDRLGTGADRKQGAGLLNAAVAVELADPSYRVSGPNNAVTPRGRDSKCVDFSTDFPNGRFGPYNIVIWNSGRLRVVAAWDATAQFCSEDGSQCQGEALDADLDLHVSRWTGSTWVNVCSSASWDSSWELCDIAANPGETYKAELIKASTNATGTCVGVAWNNYDPYQE